MPDYIDTLNDAQFLLRYRQTSAHAAACDDVCARYGCLRGDCFDDRTTNDAPPLEDAYAQDVVPASRWRAFYAADSYDAQLRDDRI